MLLPHEESVRDHIAEKFRGEFALAKELLDFAVSMPVHATNPATPDVTRRVVVVTLGLTTKIIKQYRAIIALLKLGLADSAQIIARALLESWLMVRFVLEDEFKRTINDESLSKDLRSQLYIAKILFQKRSWVNDLPDGLLSKEAVESTRHVAAEYEKMIGPAWTERIAPTRANCVGLNIRQLADRLGQSQFYDVFYKLDSQPVHAQDLLRFIGLDTDQNDNLAFNITPSDEGVSRIVRHVSLLLADCIKLVSRNLGFSMEAQADSMINAIDGTIRGND